MNFFEMMLRLKSIYVNEIVIVSCGAFYIAIGDDAVILNVLNVQKINLKKKQNMK